MQSLSLKRSKSFCLGGGPNNAWGLEVDMTMYRRMAIAIVTLIALTVSIAAQTPTDPQKARPRTAASGQDNKKDENSPVVDNRVSADEATRAQSDVSPNTGTNRDQ